MEEIFKNLVHSHPGVRRIEVFSDGAASQFKQRYLFANLHSWEIKFGVQLAWNFFATSHGKGAVDGLGGTVKRSVWRHIRAGRASITNATEYAAVAKDRNPGTHVIFIPASDIEEKENMLKEHWDGVLSGPGTQSLHSIKPDGPDGLLVAQVAREIHRSIRLRSIPKTQRKA
jgi:hypothetical protein